MVTTAPTTATMTEIIMITALYGVWYFYSSIILQHAYLLHASTWLVLFLKNLTPWDRPHPDWQGEDVVKLKLKEIAVGSHIDILLVLLFLLKCLSLFTADGTLELQVLLALVCHRLPWVSDKESPAWQIILSEEPSRLLFCFVFEYVHLVSLLK